MNYKFVIPVAFILGFAVFEGSSLLPKGSFFYMIYESGTGMAIMLGLFFTALGTTVLGFRMPITNLTEYERMLNFLQGFTGFTILCGAIVAIYNLIVCFAVYSTKGEFFIGEMSDPVTALLWNPFVGLLAAAISRTAYHILNGRLIEAEVKA